MGFGGPTSSDMALDGLMEPEVNSAKWAGHPVWLVGFRPFFPLASLTAALLPLVWMAVFTGKLPPPPSLPMLTWHAHEMFYGFGLAVLGGFLLTATKNWVSVRGHHGRALQLLVAAWLVERVAVWFSGGSPIFLLAGNLFLVTLIALLTWTLIRHRATDSYKDNFLFVIVLPLFLVAKALLLGATTFELGRDLTIGLFRMAFVVMLERTLPPFMKGAFQLTLPRVFAVDTAIKALALVLVFGPWLPDLLHRALSLLLAGLLVTRFAYWSAHRTLPRLEIAVMYLGGLALAAELVVSSLALTWVGAMSVHLFTFGTMGLIIPAMMTRIAKGHTGRKVIFDRVYQAALGLMLIAFFRACGGAAALSRAVLHVVVGGGGLLERMFLPHHRAHHAAGAPAPN